MSRLKTDFGLKEKGTFLRGGKCPPEHGGCGKLELWANADKPWVLRCGREDKCGETFSVKQLYPEIFDDWSKRYKKTPEAPNAAADAYLSHARGFDLSGLRDRYTQEYYHDQALNIGTATVRFPLPGGTYWERLIDQPGRFGKKKANFGYGGSYRGQWWSLRDMTQLAAATELWLVEGIFDSIAMIQTAGVEAVSLMSCNNYPEKALDELRRVAAEANKTPPKLIFAFDQGAAGVRYTREFVKKAREQGWICGAAQVRPDGEGDKHDWNDLALSDEPKLKAEDLAEYLWNGEVTIAPNASEKAMLIYKKDRYASFPMTFGGRQMWATFSIERIQAIQQAWMESDDPEFADFKDLSAGEKWERAAAEAIDVVEVANCVFRALYFQKDAAIEEGAYFLRVDFPWKTPTVKATFSGSAITTSGEFMKRLASVAPGALWSGNQPQMTRLMQMQMRQIRTVEAIQHTGYSIDHSAWIFGDIAVHKGRVFDKNEDDYFTLGKRSVKLRTTDRMLRIDYEPDKLNLSWVPNLVTAFQAKGVVVLAFWVLALFAEQIRNTQESLGFLEATGLPGTGKSTLLEFLWKVYGRPSYEGFDPTKATGAGIARTMGQVGNLPVVLIEGDRSKENPHAKRFEWDELKTAYNGRAVRTRAIANGGMETFEPPFRGALVIAQNDIVEGSPAITERILGIHFDKSHFSAKGKIAAEALSAMPISDISGFPVHVARHEKEILERYREAFARHETAMLKHKGIRNGRLAKNHAQLAAMLDAMRIVVRNLADADVANAHALILSMLEQRQKAVETDNPHVEWFWERFEHFRQLETVGTDKPIDHSRTTEVHAISLVHFEQRCGELRLAMPCTSNELKRALKTSKRRKFVEVKPVNSVTGKTVSCWTFRNPDHVQSTVPIN